MKKIYLYFLLAFAPIVVATAQSECFEEPPTADMSPSGLANSGLIFDGDQASASCASPQITLPIPNLDPDTPDYGYAFEVHTPNNDTVLYVSNNNMIDIMNPNGDGVQMVSGTVNVTAISFDLAAINALLSVVSNPATCAALEGAGTLPPGSCDIIIPLGTIDDLGEMIDVAGAFGTTVNSVTTALDALASVGAAVPDAFGMICYGVSGWTETETLSTTENIAELWSGPILSFTKDCTSGINSPSWASEVSLLPNPASEVLNVTFQVPVANVHFSIYDLSGKLLSQNLDSNNISIAHLNAGTYLLRIDSDGYSSYKKFVKK